MDARDEVAREGLRVLREDFKRHLDDCAARQRLIFGATLTAIVGIAILLIRSFGLA